MLIEYECGCQIAFSYRTVKTISGNAPVQRQANYGQILICKEHTKEAEEEYLKSISHELLLEKKKLDDKYQKYLDTLKGVAAK